MFSLRSNPLNPHSVKNGQISSALQKTRGEVAPDIISIASQRLPVLKLARARRVLSQGGIVVLPTDTVYGLAGNALDESAVQKLAELKGRSIWQPIAILLDHPTSIKYWAQVSPIAQRVIDTFLPGALTIVLPARSRVPLILRPEGLVGIRVPDSQLVQLLVHTCGFPLAATSANRSGKQPVRTGKEALRTFYNRVDLIIDSGRIPDGVASTVLKIVDFRIEMIREGRITRKQLERRGFSIAE